MGPYPYPEHIKDKKIHELEAKLRKIKEALKGKIDHSSWFYKNCKRQRKAEAKICQVCPFRVLIEATE